MGDTRKQWLLRKAIFDQTFINNLQAKTGLSKDLIYYLSNNSYLTKEMIDKLLDPTDESDFLSLIDAQKLLDTIREHKKDKILIYSDYDCDGICAAAIATYGLKKLGYHTELYFNSRFENGYGLHQEGIDYAPNQNCRVVLALDQGIADGKTIGYAKEAGLVVVIIDHHQQNTELPPSDALVDPHRLDDNSKFKDYCGGALTYQFISALAYQEESTETFTELLGLVALCTVSDVMELCGTNRYYLKRGLEEFNSGSLPVYEVIKADLRHDVSIEDLRFSISPPINAVGRMSDQINIAVEFFLAQDYNKALLLYRKIIDFNKERQELTKLQLEAARRQIDPQANVNILSGPYHEGLIGLIASRLLNETGKTTVVISEEGELLKGSIRAAEGVNLPDCLQQLSGLLTAFGGHESAAGISLTRENLIDFSDGFKELAKPVETNPILYLDLIYQTRFIKTSDIKQWEALEPFGPGFPYPIFGLLIEDYTFLVFKEAHIKIQTRNLVIMAFNCPDQIPKVQSGKPLKAIVKFTLDQRGDYQAILVENELRYYQNT